MVPTNLGGYECQSIIAAILIKLAIPQVLQEVAAARQIMVKCGTFQMDGYTFCLGLEGLNLLSRADASVQGLVLPVMSLIRDAIFRPQITIKPSSHFSLQIRPLAELVDLYHCRQATDPRDKVFALLGMSTGDPGAAGIVPDYEASWEDVIRKLVQFSLSHETAVTTWGTKVAVVRANGCVLGKISSTQTLHNRGGRQTMEVTWTNPAIPSNKGAMQRTLWTFYSTAKLAKKGDIVCLVKNSKHLSIVRPHEDYSSIIISQVPVSDRVLPWLPSITAFPTQLLLVWDWGNSYSTIEVPRSFRQYQSVLGVAAPGKELQTYIGKASRLLDVAAILRVAALFEEEAHRILTASKICDEGFATWGDEIMTEGLCELLLRDEGGDWTPLYGLAQQGHFGIIEWFIRAGKIKQEQQQQQQHGTMLLWYAVQTKQSTVARLLFDAGAFSMQEQLSRAVDEWERTGDEDGTFRPRVFEQFRVLSQLGSNTRRQSMAKFLLDTGIVSLEAAFWWAAENKRFTSFGAMLRNFGQYSIKYAPTWHAVLRRAAQKGDKLVVEALLVEKDMHSEITLNDDILPAIEHAAEAGQKELVSLLIGTQRPDAVFVEAAKVGFEATMRAMLQDYPPHLWNVSVRLSLVSIGYNALFAAVEHGQERIARLLLEHKKSGINMRDPCGRTALHLAILRRQRAMVELLVASGKADVRARDIQPGCLRRIWAHEISFFVRIPELG